MSDERFQQDLDAVLLEDAPRDVPEDLRRRVRQITATHVVEVRASDPIWRRPVSIVVGALVTLAVVLVVGTSRPGAMGGGPSVSPEASESTSGMPSASSRIGLCQATDLQGRILGWQGAAGSRIAEIEVTNVGTRACFVRGMPGLELVDGGGRVLIDSAAAGSSLVPRVEPSDPSFEVQPGGVLRTEVQATDYCGPAPVLPISLRFALPADAGTVIAPPDVGVASELATPPCLGTSGGRLAMNGWRDLP